ncbi:MAG: hypothetical protein Q7K57_44195 [Burkholderiaceae bacterium]|nr:hypothetical protein [Burkholderiaceae bacterium]
MESRLTVRFSGEEITKLSTMAITMGMTRADVVRLAVEGMFSSAKTTTKMAQLLEQQTEEIGVEVKRRINEISTQNKRVTTLLLRAMRADPAAEQALEKIFLGDS